MKRKDIKPTDGKYLYTGSFLLSALTTAPVAVEPHRPPVINVGTETAFRKDHRKLFQKRKHLKILGLEVSWCDHRLPQTPKEAFSEVRVHGGTTQVDFEVDRPPPADSPPGDLLITMVKERVIIYKNRVSKKWKKVKLVRISHWSDSDENAIDFQIACDFVKHANVVIGLRKEIFAKTHTATHKPTSAQRLIVTTMTHTHTHTPDNRLWSP